MKIEKETRDRWKKSIRLFLKEHGKTTDDITTVSDAWRVAFMLEIPREAYHMDHTVKDSHIEAALLRIFTKVKK